MIICLRCQNGGQPTRSVNIITPQAQLKLKNSRDKREEKVSKMMKFSIFQRNLTYQLLCCIRAHYRTYYTLMFQVLSIQVFHTNLIFTIQLKFTVKMLNSRNSHQTISVHSSTDVQIQNLLSLH